jgi:hypothetical protein
MGKNIHTVKRISTEDPLREIWKYLRFFQHTDSVVETIRSEHKIPKGKFDADVKKQASQIAYCIRQAEEYFRASTQVGLATRPNLLYYGAVSLSQALILLRNDGTHSLDARRKSPKHHHHGLELARGQLEKIRHREGVQEFFNSIECFIFTKQADEEPWGHFPLFYKSLVPPVFVVPVEIRQADSNTRTNTYITQGCANIQPIDALLGKRLNALSLLKTLPDMHYSMEELNVESDICRGKVQQNVVRHLKPVALNEVDDSYPGEHIYKNRELERQVEYHQFSINDINDEQKAALVSYLNEHNQKIEVRANVERSIILALTIEWKPAEERGRNYYPDIVEDISGEKYFIIHPKNYISEPAALLILLFCLGMLSRYYPDVWMKAIDQHIQIAELTNTLLNSVYRKFPHLILDQMTLTKHSILKA